MERILVVTFDSEDHAREASQALEQLSEEDVIAVNAAAIATRDANGLTTVVTTHYDDPQATMGGTAVGSLVGLFGGPIGLVIGAAAGSALGVAMDLKRARAGRHFTTDVADALERGQTALVAAIDEESPDAVDARLQALGGRVARHELSELADREYEREVAAVKTAIADAKAEAARSHARRRGRLRHSVDRAVAKLIRLSLRRT